ncbi:MAG: hypothetical protein QXF42_06615 [Sulfolobales archaeon]
MGLHVVVDLSKCSECRYCEVWCSFTHEKCSQHRSQGLELLRMML